VTFDVGEDAHVSIHVYDARGRRRLSAVDREMPGGSYQYRVQTSDLPSGLYLLRLSIDRAATTTPFVVIH
jgi:hypothetical protein